MEIYVIAKSSLVSTLAGSSFPLHFTRAKTPPSNQTSISYSWSACQRAKFLSPNMVTRERVIISNNGTERSIFFACHDRYNRSIDGSQLRADISIGECLGY